MENIWLATRDGIGGHLIDLETGARVWTAERLHDLAVATAADGDSLGCDRELLGSAGSSSTAAALRASAASSGAAGSTRCCPRSRSTRGARPPRSRSPPVGCGPSRGCTPRNFGE